jgi:hypothetical protein
MFASFSTNISANKIAQSIVAASPAEAENGPSVQHSKSKVNEQVKS